MTFPARPPPNTVGGRAFDRRPRPVGGPRPSTVVSQWTTGILLGTGPSKLRPEPPDIPNAWIQSADIVDGAGEPLTDPVLKAACPTLDDGPRGPAGPVPEAVRQQMHDCVARIGEKYHQVITYQPGDRYWILQWCELALFAVAAALLCGYAFYRLRRFRS